MTGPGLEAYFTPSEAGVGMAGDGLTVCCRLPSGWKRSWEAPWAAAAATAAVT